MMDAARLRGWDALERRRRRGGLPIGWLIACAAAGVGMWLLRRSAGLGEALGWWVVLAAGASAGLVMTGAWRLYWRGEAPLLARLPIGGDALYGLALARSARIAAWLALALVCAALPLVVDRLRDTGVSFAGLIVLACAAGCLVEPVSTTLAGAMVASDKAQRAVASVAGDIGGAPATVWLSIIPAAGGFATGAAVWWLTTQSHRVEPLVWFGFVGAVLAACALAWVAGRALAKRWLPAALREVAAMDRVQLAHVERTGARGLEAMWGAVAGAARPIYRKDVALARRRFPAFYLVTGGLVIAAWIAAFFGEPATRTRWAVIAAAGIAAYTAIFGRRLGHPPIERPRLLNTLPLPPRGALRAKRAYVLWRAFLPTVWAVAPGVIRSDSPISLAAIALGIASAGAILGAFLARPADD